jgi:cytochrome c oxidase subunit 3
MTEDKKYYLPAPSNLPLKGSIALICTLTGIANWLHNEWYGPFLFLFGFAALIYTIYSWFGAVIREDRAGLTSGEQVDRSFRLGMCMFIFSEVMFFAAFFGALFYVRLFVLPALGEPDSITHILLWPSFNMNWPLFNNPNPSVYAGPASVMNAWGIPILNTLALLASAVTITIAHIALVKNKRATMLVFQLITILLGLVFLFLQAREYGEAYFEKGLTLGSGIFGTIFFMLTGFHGLHVAIGTISLAVILYRMKIGDIRPNNLFAFEAVSWYWHFVDIVWLVLFIFVYWL